MNATLETNSHEAHHGEYALASGPAAVRRLFVLHNIYEPAGRRVLLKAGLRRGMHVADFGCGVGVVSRMLSEIVGPGGSVTGIDASADQIEQAVHICHSERITNAAFRVTDACDTRLPRDSFDLVYCRFLLLHLTDPAACLREMKRVLKPGGILVVEDGDLASATSVPPTALDAFASLFKRLGRARGLNYSLANDLYHLVNEAGFTGTQIEIHQPAGCDSDHGDLLAASVAEAGPAFISEGLISVLQLEELLVDMREAARDPQILALAPRMSIVWAHKTTGIQLNRNLTGF